MCNVIVSRDVRHITTELSIFLHCIFSNFSGVTAILSACKPYKRCLDITVYPTNSIGNDILTQSSLQIAAVPGNDTWDNEVIDLYIDIITGQYKDGKEIEKDCADNSAEQFVTSRDLDKLDKINKRLKTDRVGDVQQGYKHKPGDYSISSYDDEDLGIIIISRSIISLFSISIVLSSSSMEKYSNSYR